MKSSLSTTAVRCHSECPPDSATATKRLQSFAHAAGSQSSSSRELENELFREGISGLELALVAVKADLGQPRGELGQNRILSHQLPS
eukprot:5935962-Pyramimonas_sp.AAC.1